MGKSFVKIAAESVLDGEASPLVGFVAEGDAGGDVFFHPCNVLWDHGGVDDEEGFGFGDAVGDEVVDDPAAFVEHEGVLAFAGGEFGEVVGEDRIEPGNVVFAADEDLAHVGDVEYAGFLADGGVLGEDGGILHRHGTAAEGDEACAKGEVGGFERGVEDGFGHGRSLSRPVVLVNRARVAGPPQPDSVGNVGIRDVIPFPARLGIASSSNVIPSKDSGA